jgi:hypothetical protein
MSIKIIIAFIVLFANIGTAQADTVGLSWYTYHGDKGNTYTTVINDPRFGKKYNNTTRGLYYVKDSGTPLLGDNVIAGYYCNSFSKTQINESTCNVTAHAGKIFTLAGNRDPGLSWDVSVTVEMFEGYKQHANRADIGKTILPIRIQNKYLKMDAFVAPTLSARFGYARVALVGKNDGHLSFEYNFK